MLYLPLLFAYTLWSMVITVALVWLLTRRDTP